MDKSKINKLNENKLELLLIGGEPAVNFYNKNVIQFDILKSALLCGYTIKDIERSYEEYIKSSIKDTISFNKIISVAMQVKRGELI